MKKIKPILIISLCVLLVLGACAPQEPLMSTDSLIGIYRGELSGSGGNRILTLVLNGDMSASLTQDLLTGDPPVTETGTWSTEGKNRVKITLTGRGSEMIEETLTFSVAGDVLTAVDYDQSLWGSDAISLTRAELTAVPEDLIGVVWKWQQTQMGDGEIIQPSDPSRYTILFTSGNQYYGFSDCNQVSGAYSVDGAGITIEPGITTLMACPEGSLDSTFNQQLQSAVIYQFVGDHLFLDLPMDSGTMEFAP